MTAAAAVTREDGTPTGAAVRVGQVVVVQFRSSGSAYILDVGYVPAGCLEIAK